MKGLNKLHKRFVNETVNIPVESINVNAKLYGKPSINDKILCITIDGCDSRHIDGGLNNNKMPFLKSILDFNGIGMKESIATCFPTTTHPNQVSITTGLPPSDHDIIGDYFIDNNKITTNDTKSLKDRIQLSKDDLAVNADSILLDISDDLPVFVLATHDEYLEQMAYEHIDGQIICHSLTSILRNESNDSVITQILSGMEVNRMLSFMNDKANNIENNDYIDETLFILEIMKSLVENCNKGLISFNPVMSYLALLPSNYFHFNQRHNSILMMDYMSKLDEYLQYFHENGYRFGLTSCHGSNDKLGMNNQLFIINLESKMESYLTELNLKHNIDYQVILPSKHNNKLYGFAHIHLNIMNDTNNELNKHDITLQLLHKFRSEKGIYTAMSNKDACSSLELPNERIGDMVLIGDIASLFTDNDTNTSNNNYTRSWGCLEESNVPIILNQKPTESYQKMLTKGKGRIFHLLDILLNGYHNDLEHRCPYQYKPSSYPYIGK